MAAESHPIGLVEYVYMPTEAEARRARIRNERGAEYGETYRNFRTLGQQITALLEQHYQIDLPHPVPASIAALIMVSVKTNRLSRPCASQDSFDDAVNYVNIVEECRAHERLQNEAKDTAGGGGQGDRPTPAGEPITTGS